MDPDIRHLSGFSVFSMGRWRGAWKTVGDGYPFIRHGFKLFNQGLMFFVTLARFRTKPTKEIVAKTQKLFEEIVKEGARVLGVYWTLGRYDVVVISDCPDEKAHMKIAMKLSDIVSTESLLAIPAEEAIKLVE